MGYSSVKVNINKKRKLKTMPYSALEFLSECECFEMHTILTMMQLMAM